MVSGNESIGPSARKEREPQDDNCSVRLAEDLARQSSGHNHRHAAFDGQPMAAVSTFAQLGFCGEVLADALDGVALVIVQGEEFEAIA